MLCVIPHHTYLSTFHNDYINYVSINTTPSIILDIISVIKLVRRAEYAVAHQHVLVMLLPLLMTSSGVVIMIF